MMPPGGSDRTDTFILFAIVGHLAGKTPEQLADEWLEQSMSPRPTIDEMLAELRHSKAEGR
jgi:hypothetical protein